MEILTIQGTAYKVISRKAVAEFTPGTFWRKALDGRAHGRISLVKARGGSHVYEATEYLNGTYSRPVDTHTTVTGRGVR